MNKKLFSLSLAFIGLIFAACSSNSDIELTPEQPAGSNGAIVAISLNNVSTRADAPAEDGVGNENTISTLNFYVFKSTGELVQTNGFSKQSSYKFVINVSNKADLAGMNFLVGVNQPLISGIPANNTAFAYVKSHLSGALVFEAYEAGNASKGNTTEVPSLFPMSGSAINQTVTAPAGSTDSPVTSISIEVSRLVSKVESPKENPDEVEVNVLKEDLESLFAQGVTDATFALKGFVLINGLDKSDAFYTWTSEADWTGWSREGKTYLTSAFDGSGNYQSVYTGVATGDMFIAGTPASYIYENEPKSDPDNEDLYFDKATVNSFIIKGELTCIGGTDAGKTAVRYWRANLIPEDDHRVLRNTIYRLTIDGVNTIGYGTPEEAENEVVPKTGNASVNISISVAKWRVKTTNTIL